MHKTFVYFPNDLKQEIEVLAIKEKKSKAKVIREALQHGLTAKRQQSGVDVLLKIAELGRKFKPKGPRDASQKIDEYLWDRDLEKK